MIFQELLIIETWNKCHWIWHALNPKYAPLKPFQCIFPSQNQQNVKFLPEIVDFSWTTYCIDSKPACHWIWYMPQTLNYVPLKPFQMLFFQSKLTKWWIFGSLLYSPWQKMKKKHQFEQGKSVWKDLKICTYRFWGIANRNALC